MDEQRKPAAETKPVRKRKKRRRNRRLRAILATAVTLLLIVAAVLVFVNRDRLSGENLRHTFGRDAEEESDSLQSEPYGYEVGTGQVFAVAGNGFAVASSSALEYLDRDGRTVYKQVVSYNEPAVFGSEAGVLFCDLGADRAIRLNAAGEKLELSPAGELITAAMNGEGWVTLVTSAAGYKGLVEVFDPGGELRYQWWSGSGYVLRAVVGPDNRTLAVLTAETGGGKLHIFRLDSETEQAAYSFGEELPFDLAFHSDDSLCVISEASLCFLRTDGTLIAQRDYSGYYLLDYELGEHFVAVYISAYRSGGGGYLESFSPAGELLAVQEQESDPLSLCINGRQLLVLNSGGWMLCHPDLSVQRQQNALTTAKKALLRQDGSILLLYSYFAERIR